MRHGTHVLPASSTRPSSTTTRIKTYPFLLTSSWYRVRDHLPLQQGLRRSSGATGKSTSSCTRPSSTTTRIKTQAPTIPPITNPTVRDHLPLQQGLRHNVLSCSLIISFPVRDHLPLQQGLRPMAQVSFHSTFGCTRPSSTTTRIKTENYLLHC